VIQMFIKFKEGENCERIWSGVGHGHVRLTDEQARKLWVEIGLRLRTLSENKKKQEQP
jgi:hypothetical protein